jgi:hypothetical protein
MESAKRIRARKYIDEKGANIAIFGFTILPKNLM